jgi:hypothetical protein
VSGFSWIQGVPRFGDSSLHCHPSSPPLSCYFVRANDETVVSITTVAAGVGAVATYFYHWIVGGHSLKLYLSVALFMAPWLSWLKRQSSNLEITNSYLVGAYFSLSIETVGLDQSRRNTCT